MKENEPERLVLYRKLAAAFLTAMGPTVPEPVRNIFECYPEVGRVEPPESLSVAFYDWAKGASCAEAHTLFDVAAALSALNDMVQRLDNVATALHAVHHLEQSPLGDMFRELFNNDSSENKEL